MKILLVAATDSEAGALKRVPGLEPVSGGFIHSRYEIISLVTGVGSVATSWTLTKWISSNSKPDLALNIGISGSYRSEIGIGEVVVPVSDCFADAGIEDSEEFKTLGEARLSDPDQPPFREGKIFATGTYFQKAAGFLRPVSAITVNTATGSEITKEKLIKKFNPDIETMEGATFFYICSRGKIPFLAIRSVSNIVERRNRDKWNIPLAIDNLSEKLTDFLLMLE